MISSNNPFKFQEFYKLSNGNSKIGQILNSSNTPSNTIQTNSRGEILGSCPTTCKGHNKKGKEIILCYGLKGNYTFDQNKIIMAQNTWGWRYDYENITKDYELQIAQLDTAGRLTGGFSAMRIHANGDFVNYEELCFWLSMAKKYKHVRFYTYTKKYDLFMDAIKNGLIVEHIDNFTLNVSVWGNYGREFIGVFNDFFNTNVFEVVAKKSSREHGHVRCIGYDSNGKKTNKDCSLCGFCWKRSNLHIECVEHA